MEFSARRTVSRIKTPWNMFDEDGGKNAVKLFDSCKCRLRRKDSQFFERIAAEYSVANQDGALIIRADRERYVDAADVFGEAEAVRQKFREQLFSVRNQIGEGLQERQQLCGDYVLLLEARPLVCSQSYCAARFNDHTERRTVGEFTASRGRVRIHL